MPRHERRGGGVGVNLSAFQPNPNNVNYSTIDYNDLPRNARNAPTALRAILTQLGLETDFMHRISSSMFSRFITEYSNSTKLVEQIILDLQIYEQLGIEIHHLDALIEAEMTDETTEEAPSGIIGRLGAVDFENLYDDNGRIRTEVLDRYHETMARYTPTSEPISGYSGNDVLEYCRQIADNYSGNPFVVDSLASMEEQAREAGMVRQVPPITGHGQARHYNPYSHRERSRRSDSDMLMRVISGENFPRPSFVNWSNDSELREAINDWYRSVEYKEHWIFSRREREGFNRRNIGQFGLDDVLSRIEKQKRPHPLNTPNSRIYDWKLGGTDWTLRLELFTYKNEDNDNYDPEMYFLVCRHIHNPTNAEVKYEVRYWNGNKFTKVKTLWTETRNNEEQVSRQFAQFAEEARYEEVQEEISSDDDWTTSFINPSSGAQEAPSYAPQYTFSYHIPDDEMDEIDDLLEEESEDGEMLEDSPF